ncbi:MAG TPA: hypothetical protein VHN20_03975, partial [Beijerinckiaceae bacterium]|nr:hypothetical protein [Beijerinckiaceae bacterium]
IAPGDERLVETAALQHGLDELQPLRAADGREFGGESQIHHVRYVMAGLVPASRRYVMAGLVPAIPFRKALPVMAGLVPAISIGKARR